MSEVKEIRKEIIRLSEEVKTLDVGSEEYLNAAKAASQLAESVDKLKPIDWVQLAKDGVGVLLFALLLIFNLDKVIDSKPVNLFRNFFRLF